MEAGRGWGGMGFLILQIRLKFSIYMNIIFPTTVVYSFILKRVFILLNGIDRLRHTPNNRVMRVPFPNTSRAVEFMKMIIHPCDWT